jgi:hypothetical protein
MRCETTIAFALHSRVFHCSNSAAIIVSDWKLSKHSGVDVTCETCHGTEHTFASDVAKVKIPTPET